MIEEYVTPATVLVAVMETQQPLCMSTGALAPLEEKNDLEGLDWSCN